MRILLAGGGTAGHINPAIAIAQYFKSHSENCEILFAGTPNGMESTLVKKAGFNFTPIEIMGFSRSFSMEDISHNIKAVYKAMLSNSRAKKIINDFNPDIVIGTGGYVSGPIVMAAAKKGIKTAIHEQNAFPGVTTRLLAKKVNIVFSAVEEAKSHLDVKGEFYVVGNPVRESIMAKTYKNARKELGLDDRMCILSFGGSLGADTINKLSVDIINWHYKQGLVNHIHGYGRLGKEKFPQLLKENGIDLSLTDNVKAYEFIDNMDTCLAAADLVICRAGAITISEIEATGKACILIPSPNVTANHQYHNAMVLKNKNACFILEEKDYTKEKIIEMVKELYNDKEKLEEMSKNAQNLAIFDTSKRIYDKICNM
ncbi:MAG: undecaprenyldiphospho-muramoylpentapeptide beta-N-acetylglucosaminyltransferase [Oscillospiraceae bacterium]